MLFSRRVVKQVVAGTAGVMFLLCYSAGFAQGYSPRLHAPEKSEMPPCHLMMGDESTPSHTSHASSNCHDVASFQANDPAPDLSKVFVVAVVDIAVPVSEPRPFHPPSLRVKPPPLRLLHCCLRN